MAVESDVDETRVVLVQSNLARYGSNMAAFTIAPTLECNFRCPYCYEVGKRYNTMTEEVIENTIKFINEQSKDMAKISIAWYGGEPLLRIDLIEKITQGIENVEKYSANIVTNGYYLTEENAKKLKELHVKYAQVTIDGPPDIHNTRRCLPTGADTFFVIMENIRKAAEHIFIAIRINVDKTNMQRVDEILDYLIEYGLQDKVGVYLAPVDAINDGCHAPSCFTDSEFATEQINFAARNMKRGFNFLELPHFNPAMCGAVSPHSYVIDPLGDLYKCWDHIGYKEESFGNIADENINVKQSNYLKWIDYDVFQYEDCKGCNILPICMGGCPFKNIKKGEMQCGATKYNATDMMRLLREMTEMYINKECG
ncbi:MAG: radical SAM protein [Lachnospiraceae bacterium]|nr:radical SAM protein [Lachnospiraceae bacterium]